MFATAFFVPAVARPPCQTTPVFVETGQNPRRPRLEQHWHSRCKKKKKRKIDTRNNLRTQNKQPYTMSQESICPICLDPLANLLTTTCGHSFHPRCIATHALHNGLSCPCCRATMEIKNIYNDDDMDYNDDDMEREYYFHQTNILLHRAQARREQVARMIAQQLWDAQFLTFQENAFRRMIEETEATRLLTEDPPLWRRAGTYAATLSLGFVAGIVFRAWRGHN